MATYEAVCAGCGEKFTSKSPRAKWHSPACKKRAQRKPDTNAEPSSTDAAASAGKGADHKPTAETEYGRDVLAAVRAELEKAKCLDSVDGRVALYLARKSIDPECRNPAAMFKEMRQALAVALANAVPSGGPTPDPDPTPTQPDEVEKARQKRAEKAGEAATR